MKLAIMQPYFFPYIGYFQLMQAVDEFVIYDNIQYTKQGWINRNRILVNGSAAHISLPLKKAPDGLDVRERCLAESWPMERKKLLNRIREAYRKAPLFEQAFPVVETSLQCEENNLFAFLLHSLNAVRAYLDIRTPLIVSSSLPIDFSLKAERKVIAICQARHAQTYLNPIGGVELYRKETFREAGIELSFLKAGEIIYRQFEAPFVPFLSILDLMMFNSPEQIRHFLSSGFTLQ